MIDLKVEGKDLKEECKPQVSARLISTDIDNIRNANAELSEKLDGCMHDIAKANKRSKRSGKKIDGATKRLDRLFSGFNRHTSYCDKAIDDIQNTIDIHSDILYGIIIVAILLTIFGGIKISMLKSDIKDLKSEVQTLKEENSNLEADLTDVQRRTSEHGGKIKALTSDVWDMDSDLYTLKLRLVQDGALKYEQNR